MQEDTSPLRPGKKITEKEARRIGGLLHKVGEYRPENEDEFIEKIVENEDEIIYTRDSEGKITLYTFSKEKTEKIRKLIKEKLSR